MTDERGIEGKAKALILFSGKSRAGDVQHELADLGWAVCAADILCPTPTNLLDEGVWDMILRDIEAGEFEAVWFAAPCNTFSPLRRKPPGPRPLRDKRHILGLPRFQLKQSEQKQLKEANILVDRTAQAARALIALGKPWGLENPTHGFDQPEMWDMPSIKDLVEHPDATAVDFDQCRYGCETVKPTKFLSFKLDFSSFRGVRCNHPKVKQTREDGSTYWAAHPNPVQRWRKGSTGMERASKALGEYSTELSAAIAQAMHSTQRRAAWLARELDKEDL